MNKFKLPEAPRKGIPTEEYQMREDSNRIQEALSEFGKLYVL
jgi:hypothetical protein